MTNWRFIPIWQIPQTTHQLGFQICLLQILKPYLANALKQRPSTALLLSRTLESTMSADQIIKTVPFSHRSARTKELFKRGIEVQKILKSSPALDINFESPHSEITLLSRNFDIPYLLARQLVSHPHLEPFYLLVPAAHVQWHIKKSWADADGWIRIPYLNIDRPWVFGANVHSVGSARVNADTVFVDLVVSPDLRISGVLPKDKRWVSRRSDFPFMAATQKRASARDQWRQKHLLKRPEVRNTYQ